MGVKTHANLLLNLTITLFGLRGVETSGYNGPLDVSLPNDESNFVSVNKIPLERVDMPSLENGVEI